MTAASDAVTEVVAETTDLDAEVDFFVSWAGFRIDAISPADDPNTALLSHGGLRVRFVRGDADRPIRLRTSTAAPERSVLRSPGGPTIEIEPADDSLHVPAGVPELVVTRADAGAWVMGRAGMRYRDLLPGRWGGRFVASHIHIPDEGPVPDYVHYHHIRFQLIVVKAGWVEVVYEDQGPPFVLEAGDAVLQPPAIRHRVLRSSAGLEVIEIGCPAEHMTLADHDLVLPTADLRPDRSFGGQRFARSILRERPSAAWRIDGFRACDTGFGEATEGLVGARIVEPDGSPGAAATVEDTEFSMLVVLDGTVVLEHDGIVASALRAGDSVALPSGTAVRLLEPSPDLRLLDVTSPA